MNAISQIQYIVESLINMQQHLCFFYKLYSKWQFIPSKKFLSATAANSILKWACYSTNLSSKKKMLPYTSISFLEKYSTCRGFASTNSKDPYEVLNLPRNASLAEIKARYRKLAKKYHPDVCSDKNAAQNMATLTSAYESLLQATNSVNKNRFQSESHYGDTFSFDHGFQSYADSFNISDINSYLRDTLFKNNIRYSNSSNLRGEHLVTEISVEFMESVKGCQKYIHLKKKKKCSTCHGNKCSPGYTPSQCHKCEGSGLNKREHGSFVVATECSNCKGSGQIISMPCRDCNGSGIQLQDSIINIYIFPGIRDGMQICVPNEGHASSHQNISGDLFVKVNVKPHSHFKVEADDLYITVPLTFKQLLLGDTIEVPTLNQPITIKLDPGEDIGKSKRIKGKGLKRIHQDGHGDLIIHWGFKTPANLSDEQKNMVLKLNGSD
ncbi:chaperone protein DnaJ-like [Hylaeus volcanicus]|uniref:chaperone protein DnaJ-like n=1 Tax=Hylaeus volcanicus TaxID=313075 RepID=UPI0023B82210|nr:chaperone protein DnaJ-like [Hylaeus volcanicus]